MRAGIAKQLLFGTGIFLVLLVLGGWFFIGPLFGTIPSKTFLSEADRISASEKYKFVEAKSYRPSSELRNSKLPWRYQPILEFEKMKERYVTSDYAMELIYADGASAYHVFVHVWNGDVWLLDIVGDSAAQGEIAERQKLFRKQFPTLNIRARVAKISEPGTEED